jgi:transposase InsO family protein
VIYNTLKARGVCVGKERVRKLMQLNGIRSKTKRRFIVTTDSKHNLPIAPNIVNRNFTASAPDQVWTTFVAALKAYGMIASMSRRGDYWDNASTESLWSRLKVARVHGRKFATMAECKDEVMDWLQFYNSTWLHSTLNNVRPRQFEEQWHAARPQQVA